AAFSPAAVLCFTGPGDRATAVAGLRELAAEAERVGVRLALEPFQAEGIESHAHHFAGVHLNDWRNGTRGWADRVLPGDGVADVPAILAALERAGWDGYYDLEVFSDNGAFGTAYSDSLWDVEPAELVRRGRESFTYCWEERRVAA